QFPRNNNFFCDLLSSNCALYFVVRQSGGKNGIVSGPRGYDDPTPHIAVNLHRNFNFFFRRESGVVLWPCCAEDASLLRQHLPQLMREIWRERSKQECQA